MRVIYSSRELADISPSHIVFLAGTRNQDPSTSVATISLRLPLSSRGPIEDSTSCNVSLGTLSSQEPTDRVPQLPPVAVRRNTNRKNFDNWNSFIHEDDLPHNMSRTHQDASKSVQFPSAACALPCFLISSSSSHLASERTLGILPSHLLTLQRVNPSLYSQRATRAKIGEFAYRRTRESTHLSH